MILILIAGINLFLFYWMGIAKRSAAVSPEGNAETSAKVVASASLVLWIAVIIFGRLIMYNDTLLYALGL